MLRQYTEALQAEVSQRDNLIELLRALLGPQVCLRCCMCLPRKPVQSCQEPGRFMQGMDHSSATRLPLRERVHSTMASCPSALNPARPHS